MEQPKKFTVLSWSEKKKDHEHKHTNDENTALNYKIRMAAKNGDAEMYIDTRYEAKLRLYKYFQRKNAPL